MNELILSDDFLVLSSDETVEIDGGGIGAFFVAVGSGVVKAATAVGTIVGGGPVVGGVVIVLGTAALVGGIYAGLNS